MPSTDPVTCGARANKDRSGKGTLSTPWRMGSRGNISSTNNAAMRLSLGDQRARPEVIAQVKFGAGSTAKVSVGAS